MREQFELDYANMKEGKSISLLAKWMATPDSSVEKTKVYILCQCTTDYDFLFSHIAGTHSTSTTEHVQQSRVSGSQSVCPIPCLGPT